MTRKGRILEARVCAHCKRNDGHEGPRPPGSMLRWLVDRMGYACSTACAVKLGWRAMP